MRWLILPVLWFVAVVAAVVVLRRLRRGRPVVLTGRFSPRLVRMIAVVLVVLGAGGEESTADKAHGFPLTPVGPNANDQLPMGVDESKVQAWLAHQTPGSHWAQFKKEATLHALGKLTKSGKVARLYVEPFSPAFAAVVKEGEPSFNKGTEPSHVAPKELLKALDEMEKYGFYDHWLNAYLWRMSAGAKETADLPELHKRLAEHARITDTLIAAYGQVRPLMQPPRAWMSKAGPRPQDRLLIAAYQRSLQDMVATARKLYPTSDEGTWKRDGLVLLSPVKGTPAPNLLRAGKVKGFPEGEKTRVGRLDLLESPKDKAVVLEHEWLSRVELPAGRVVSVWELPEHLTKGAKEKLRAKVKQALDGDEKSVDDLEKVLPLAHAELRAALKGSPKAKGAPRLRMILALFDDALMPALAEPPGDAENDPINPGIPGRLGGFQRDGRFE
jgi:hypothetical protein